MTALFQSGGAPAPSRRGWLRAASAIGLAGCLAGCGFRLRQAPRFAFATLWAPALLEDAPLRRALRLALVQSGVAVLGTATGAALAPNTGAPVADAVFEVLQERSEKAVVGSTAAGQVREFQLRLYFKFRLSTPDGRVLLEDNDIYLQRDISYSESIALSKAEEEAELLRDMQTDAVQQILRRLSAVRALR